MSSDTDDPVLQAFDRVCNRLAGFDDTINPEWVDGFLTGVLAGPRAVPQDEWLAAMAGDAFARTFGDPQDVAEARAALQARWRLIAAQLDPEALLDEPDALRLSPLMALWDDAARAEVVERGVIDAEAAADTLLTGAVWAEGFLDAVDRFQADWQEPAGADEDALAFYQACLAQVAALTLDRAALAEHLAAEYPGQELSRDELVDEACFAAQDLRVFWVDHAPRPATRRVEAGPGRNDPCPCGSGRKFKRCHGAN